MSENEKWSMWDASSRMVDPEIRLIHPLSTTTGPPEVGSVQHSCRQWAVDQRLMLVGGVASCAHGLYSMSTCPAGCWNQIGLDHTSVWARADGRRADPFVLTHPYVDEIPPEMIAYAAHHGLAVRVGEGDDWYGHGSLPIRFDMLSDGQSAWPLQAKLSQLLALYPPRWEGADDIVDRTRRVS